jgi:hypothetical protein
MLQGKVHFDEGGDGFMMAGREVRADWGLGGALDSR